ncbi:MAG: HAD family hydrolase [Acidiferrobacterales bacterium]
MATIGSEMAIKAITLDLDGTLWDAEPALAEAERKVHAWFASHYPLLAEMFSIDELRTLRHQLAGRTPRLRHDVTELRKASVRLAARLAGVDPAVSEEAFQVFMRHRNRVQLYEDTLPALEDLRRRYTLCSLTNGNADLDEIGLSHVFHHSLSAAQIGAAKPAPDMFLAVCGLAGVQPEESVHIGDEPETDIAGASAAGCRTIWVNRTNAAWDYAWRADAEITSLNELSSLLASWERDGAHVEF